MTTQEAPIETKYLQRSDGKRPSIIATTCARPRPNRPDRFDIHCDAVFAWTVNGDEAVGIAQRRRRELWPAEEGWGELGICVVSLGLNACQEIARMVGQGDAAEMPAPGRTSTTAAASPSAVTATRETVILRARQLLSRATRGPWFLKDGQVSHNSVSRGYLDSLPASNEENNNAFLSNVHELLIQLIDLDSHSCRQIAGLVEKLAETEEKLKIANGAFQTTHDKSPQPQVKIGDLGQCLEDERKRAAVTAERLARAEVVVNKIREMHAAKLLMLPDWLEKEMVELAKALDDVPEEANTLEKLTVDLVQSYSRAKQKKDDR